VREKKNGEKKKKGKKGEMEGSWSLNGNGVAHEEERGKGGKTIRKRPVVGTR